MCHTRAMQGLGDLPWTAALYSPRFWPCSVTCLPCLSFLPVSVPSRVKELHGVVPNIPLSGNVLWLCNACTITDFSPLGRGRRRYFVLLETGIKTASCLSVNQSRQFLINYFTGRTHRVCWSVKTSLTCLPRVSEIFFHVLFNMKPFFNKVILKIKKEIKRCYGNHFSLNNTSVLGERMKIRERNMQKCSHFPLPSRREIWPLFWAKYLKTA